MTVHLRQLPLLHLLGMVFPVMVSAKEMHKISTDLRWLHKCTCSYADPHAFFIKAGQTIDPVALNISRACPSRREELIFAYARDIRKGFFAGVSAGQRSKLTLEQALEYIENDPPEWEHVPPVVQERVLGTAITHAH